VTNKATAKSDDTAENKYIKVEDITKYPEALYQFIMGRHPIGMPISWLRFMVYICSAGGKYSEYIYMAQQGEKDYSEDLTDEYKTKLEK